MYKVLDSSGGISVGPDVKDDNSWLVTKKMLLRVKDLRAKGFPLSKIGQRIGCTTAATGLIVDGKIGLGDPVPKDMKMLRVKTTRCTTCGCLVSKLPDGKMPCFPCRIRAKM